MNTGMMIKTESLEPAREEDTKRVGGDGTGNGNPAMAIESNDDEHGHIKREEPIVIAPDTVSSAVVKPRNDANSDSPKGGWYWLLAPDGSPAMVGKNNEDTHGTNNFKSEDSTPTEIKTEVPKQEDPTEMAIKPDPDASSTGVAQIPTPAAYYRTKRSRDEDEAPSSKNDSNSDMDITSIEARPIKRNRRNEASRTVRRSHRATPIVNYAESDDESNFHQTEDDEDDGHDDTDEDEDEDDDDHDNADDDEDDAFQLTRNGHDNNGIGDTNNHTSKNSRKWEAMFQLLVEYKDKHGHTRVNKRTNGLGSWVSHQRVRRISEYRQKRLNSIGFEWQDPKRANWMDMYQRLVAYKKKYKHVCVPRGWEEDPKLGKWVRCQRYYCKQSNRIDLLNKIGFVWNVTKSEQPQQRDSWMTMYQHLVAYKKKYKHVCVPIKWEEDPKLGRWVFNQRQRCKESYRIDLLNKIGFVWKKDKDTWMNMYQRLVAYKKKYKNVCVPQGWEEDPKLARWVSHQRQRCKESHRIDLLNKIGFVWKVTKSEQPQQRDSWMNMYQRLVAYKKKYKNVCVPQKWEEDPKLARWVSRQRNSCKESYHIDLLNKIGFVWNVKESRERDSWMNMYQRLVAYKKKYKNVCVPRGWEKDPKLGLWVYHQRQRCKESNRIDLLNKIGFVWNVKESENRATWMNMYHCLLAYKKKYKNVCVPQKWEEDPKLGKWVSHQRQYCKESHRIDLLNKIGFVWNAKPKR